MAGSPVRRIVAEGVGTALLLATVVGSGIMGEIILTFGSVSGAHFNPAVTIADASQGGVLWRTVPGYVLAASTSFANPAVTIARTFTDTFAGIRPSDVPGFVLGQCAGAAAATLLFRWLVPPVNVGAAVIVEELVAAESLARE